MDKIKKLTLDEFTNIASQKPFDQLMVEKDYFVTMLLYLLKDVEGLYFKGGTALQKIFLDYSRLSEDIDFTVTRDIEEVSKELVEKIKRENFFASAADRFSRIIIFYFPFSFISRARSSSFFKSYFMPSNFLLTSPLRRSILMNSP